MRAFALLALSASIGVHAADLAALKLRPANAAGPTNAAGRLRAAARTTLPRAPHWTPQASGVTARLRGVSVVNQRVAWASGTNGTVIRTADGGRTWTPLTVPESSGLDFRDVDAVDANTAWVLSIGPGEASRIFKTTDAGATWTRQYLNTDPKGFLDAMAFRDARNGFVVGDSIDRQFFILQTRDGGTTWTRIPSGSLPPALDGEGAYAASGTNVAVAGSNVWIATTASRVLRSADRGRTWRITKTALPTGSSAGIFSIAVRGTIAVVVGGDYKNETAAVDNVATSADGGATWRLAKGLTGYRSAVAFVPALPRTLLAVGPAGADYSTDNGRRWRRIEGPGFHAVAFAPGSNVGWAVGEKGALAKIEM